MRRWEAWERETQTVEYQVANGKKLILMEYIPDKKFIQVFHKPRS